MFNDSRALTPRDTNGMRNLRDFLSGPAREQGRLRSAMESAKSSPCTFPAPRSKDAAAALPMPHVF